MQIFVVILLSIIVVGSVWYAIYKSHQVSNAPEFDVQFATLMQSRMKLVSSDGWKRAHSTHTTPPVATYLCCSLRIDVWDGSYVPGALTSLVVSDPRKTYAWKFTFLAGELCQATIEAKYRLGYSLDEDGRESRPAGVARAIYERLYVDEGLMHHSSSPQPAH